MSLRHAIASAALVALAVGCGGAYKEPSTTPTTPQPTPSARPAEPDTPEPTTVDEALEQIRVAKGRLTPPHDAAPTKPTAQPGPHPAPGTQEPLHAGSACGDGCRAITSMRRAVTALCRMTGDDDARCKDARETLQSREAKLASCGCR